VKKNGAALTEAGGLPAAPENIGTDPTRPLDPVPTLESILDTRVKDMLALCTEPKDLIAAVKVATEYYAVTRKPKDGDEPGSGFKA
jgi:hypothetical protein